MKYVVVGASGFLGRRVYDSLKDRDELVVGTSSKQTSRFVKFDLATDCILTCLPDRFKNKKDDLCVIITAAISQIDYCKDHLEESRAVNVSGTKRLINDLTSMGAKIVYLSSSFVFDGKKGWYSENDKRAPVCEYGWQKAEIEDYLAFHATDALIIRPDKMISTDPKDKMLLSEWYNQKGTIRCMRGQIFSPTLVDDVARAIVLLIKKKAEGVYHVANVDIISRHIFAAIFFEQMGIKRKTSEVSFKTLKFSDPRPLQTSLNPIKLLKFLEKERFCFTRIEDVISEFKKKVN
jgi:dTDP-4-dehydrorhamnose reductase